MANKNYSDDFFYEYTPKEYKDEIDESRDLSSFSTPQTPKEPIKPARSPAGSHADTGSTRQKISPTYSAPVRTTASAPKKNVQKPVTKVSYYAGTSGKFAKGVINKYGEICMTGLSTIVKVIAFVVAFAIIIGSLILGIMLFASKTGLTMLSLVAIIGGVILAALFFFPIYGIGHIICQNNEILRIFTDEPQK